MTIEPWWQHLKLRPEIALAGGALDDVQMSLFGALYGFSDQKPPYSDAAYYGQITHPSQNLVDLLAQVAVRLAALASVGTAAPAVFRLDQGMGGGKSHGLVGLWHLAAHASEFAQTDIGREALELAKQKVGAALPLGLNSPRVVVLACDNMTAGVGNPMHDGPATSLHERFLWRLFEGDQALYQKFQPHFADKSQIAAAIRATKKPVLMLVDEVMNYVSQLSDSKNADLATRDMAFLRALLDAVNDVPGAALVVVMIASDKDTMNLDKGGEARRHELASQLDRNGKPATVTSNTDFAAILRRRLFQNRPDEALAAQTADRFWNAMQGNWKNKVFTEAFYATQTAWREAVARCFPFHPALLELAEKEWSNVVGFQRVRSTIRIFAATAWVLQQEGNAGAWTPLLIGTGDLTTRSATVREALLGSGLILDERTVANFRQVAATDVVSDDDKGGHARELDLARNEEWAPLNPRAAQRMATALFLLSITGVRSQGRLGATEGELKSAAFVPEADFSLTHADVVLAGLKNPDEGLAALELLPASGSNAPRLLLSTRQTVRMLFRANLNTVSEEERDDEFAALTTELIKNSFFDEKKFLGVTHAETKDSPLDIMRRNGLDEARKTRLVVLDPRKFTLLNGADQDTREAIKAAFGIGTDKLMVAWPSSLVFAVVNTYRRNTARQQVQELVAWNRVISLLNAQTEPDQLAVAHRERNKAKDDATTAIKGAFQHVVYLGDNNGQKEERFIHLDEKTETALDSSHVWKALVAREKAFVPKEFSAKALLANLTLDDFNRPLDEVRNLFWMSPRMPLLAGGERELQLAIYNAIKDGQLRLIRLNGEEVSCHSPNDINLSLTNVRLAPPVQEEAFPTDDIEPAPNPQPAPSKSAPSRSASTKDVTLRFTVNVPLDEAKRESTYNLFSHLASMIDSRASSVQATVVINVPPDDAASLVEIVKTLEGSTNQELL